MATRQNRRLGDGGPSGSETDLDRVFELLSNPSRRRLLACLAETAPLRASVTFDELNHRADDRDQFRTRLHHVHLPKLEESGLVRWDRERQRVSSGPAFEQVRPLLDLFDENPDALPEEWP